MKNERLNKADRKAAKAARNVRQAGARGKGWQAAQKYRETTLYVGDDGLVYAD